MRINLLCSDRHLPSDVLATLKQDHWGGIDRGALILINHSINPVFSVGDFDSVLEEAVNRGFTEIHIYGATGGRLDHFMGVLQILQKPKYIEQNIIIIVEDLQNEIKLLKQGIHEIHKLQSYPYVSFIPVNEVVALSLNGFKYNLNNQPLEKGSTLTLSNEVKEKVAQIEVHDGQVLQIRSRDAN